MINTKPIMFSNSKFCSFRSYSNELQSHASKHVLHAENLTYV